MAISFVESYCVFSHWLMIALQNFATLRSANAAFRFSQFDTTFGSTQKCPWPKSSWAFVSVYTFYLNMVHRSNNTLAMWHYACMGWVGDIRPGNQRLWGVPIFIGEMLRSMQHASEMKSLKATIKRMYQGIWSILAGAAGHEMGK